MMDEEATESTNGVKHAVVPDADFAACLEWARRELAPYREVPLTPEQERGLALWGKIAPRIDPAEDEKS